MSEPVRLVTLYLGVNKEDIPAVQLLGHNVHDKFVASASIFPNPNPSMPIFLGQLQALDQAQIMARGTKAKGAASARDAARDVVWGSLKLHRAYAENVCNSSPANAATWAGLAGFGVGKPGTRVKEILTALLTTTPGTVVLKAHAKALVASGQGKAKSRVFLWRYTVDGSKTFVLVDGTSVATVVISGLPAMTTVGFQVCAKDSIAQGPWSQTVSLLIH
jgi:hypothetical protein